jgi:hemerythrin-like domain-containing protein
MKRANQLQPLSRQHHLGLHIGRHAKECADNPQEIAEHWQALSSYMNDMRHHFKIEDNLIVDALLPHQSTQPEVASALDTLEEQHKQLNALTAEIKASQENKNGHANDSVVTVEQVKALANLLYDHVRFEERELFPMVEKYLTEPELNAIYHASPDNIKHVDEQR